MKSSLLEQMFPRLMTAFRSSRPEPLPVPSGHMACETCDATGRVYASICTIHGECTNCPCASEVLVDCEDCEGLGCASDEEREIP